MSPTEVSWPVYEQPLLLPVPRKRKWRVPFGWRVDVNGMRIVIEPNYSTNLNSSPRILWRISPPASPENAGPSLAHDHLYEHQPCTRKEADLVYYALMRRNGAWNARLNYWGLRLGGWLAWWRCRRRRALRRAESPVR